MKLSYQNILFTKAMLPVFRTNIIRVFLTLIIISPLTICQQTSAATLKEQRLQYLDAKKALKAGKIKTFTKLSEGLKDYPLYAYLQQDHVQKNRVLLRPEQMYLPAQRRTLAFTNPVRTPAPVTP